MNKVLMLTDNTVETIRIAYYDNGIGLVKYDKGRYTEDIITLGSREALEAAVFIYSNVKREK